MAATEPKTVVSLLSGATEAIFAMGLEQQLVGCSHECDYPAAAVAALPTCSLALVDHTDTAAAIDAQVKALSDTGEPMYKLEAATVAALAPDVIIVQDSCRICAVSPSALAGAGPALLDCEVVTLRPRTLQDVMGDIVSVGAALGHRQLAADYASGLHERLDRLPPAPQLGGAAVKVAVLEWVDPLMSCGYWIPELVAAAGCRCILAGAGERPGYVTLPELLAAAPDIVIIASCGFDVRRCASELVAASAQSRQAVAALAGSIGGAGKVWVADGNRFFNRSGPGVVESAVIVGQAARGGEAVPGEPDLRGTAGFVSLEEALEMEGTTLTAFGGDAAEGAAAVAAQQPAAAVEEAAAAKASALAGAQEVVAALRRGDVAAAHALSAVAALMPVETYR